MDISEWDDYIREDQSADMRIELLFSKVIVTDTCNTYFISTTLDTLKVPDATYLKYYKLTPTMSITSTRMGCLSPEKIRRPVSVSISRDLKLFPMDNVYVIHVPKDVNVNYRIWSATKQ